MKGKVRKRGVHHRNQGVRHVAGFILSRIFGVRLASRLKREHINGGEM